MLDKITKGGYALIRIISSVLMIVFLIYSMFTLWDMYRTEIKAFASYDLLKYRPNIENEEPPYLDELLEINPDTVGWVTIYGTNIDYPIVKGANDNEYINKSATGEYSISGAIFMSQLNSKDFSDPYTLVYGHHMENGSMFGDIDKFKEDRNFFYNTDNNRFKKDEGVLIMQEKVWNLKVFAVVETSAYDNMVYRSDKSEEEMADMLQYIEDKATYVRDAGESDKILALSTCDSAVTLGRTILMCKMELRTDPLPTREAEPLTPHRKAVGHPMAGAYWALMNLICLLATLFSVLRVIFNKQRISSINRKNLYIIKISLIDAMLAGVSALLFIITEDLHKPVQIVDVWTLPMVLIFGAVWLLERNAFRRHMKHPEIA